MKVVVLGATGTMGAAVSDRLAAHGIDVVRASRGAGVDAQTGAGLASAVAGADVVVDCLNTMTQSAKTATTFFGSTASNVADAALAVGARVVCLSICNAANPAVNAKMGYYQGKARQEEVYQQRLGDRLSLVRTTQWFELAETIVSRYAVGPVAAMPRMVTAPLAAADGADVLVGAIRDDSSSGSVIEVRGPAQMDLVDVARALRARRGKRGIVIPLPMGGRALRDGGLIPANPDVVTATTLQQWLA